MSDFDFWSDANLHQNKLNEAVIGNVTSSGVEGQLGFEAHELKVYVGGDVNDWVALGASGDVTALKERMTTAEGKITTLEGKVSTLETNVGTKADLQSVDTAFGRIAKNAANISAVDGRLTTAETKLAGIEAGAEVNVQADWSITDTTSDAFIKNKPTLGTAAAFDVGTAAGNIPQLDSNGKLANSTIPPLAIGELAGTVASKTALTTLSSAEKGDIAKVEGDSTANNNGVYFLTGAYDTITNWIQIVGPSNVISVNGETGIVVLDATKVLTSAQQTAVNSGIDATKVGQIATNETAISGLDTRLTTAEGKVGTLESKFTGAVSAAATGSLITVNANGVVTAVATAGISNVDGLQSALDAKLDDSQLKTNFTDASDANIPSQKAVADALAGKVDKETGKGLSTNDYTTDEKTKLAGIATGAQVNVIESISVNGDAQTISGKAVNIAMPVLQVKEDITTAAGTATTISGVTAGKTPRCVQVYDEYGTVVLCHIVVGAGSLSIKTTSSHTGVTVAWME